MELTLLLLIAVIAVSVQFDRRLKAQEREIADLRRQLGGFVQQPPLIAAPPFTDLAAPLQPDADQPGEMNDGGLAAPPPPVPPPLPPELDGDQADWPKPDSPPRRGWRDLEAAFAGRWLTWLGGATVALGAAFFIKLSIDQGWLSPGLRVAFGLLAGFALIIGGEWLRRKGRPKTTDPTLDDGGSRTDQVPVALTGAGLFTAFASLYGGFVLFDLLPPWLAFAGLAALSLLGVALALLQGPYIAALGLLGGYATPILVPPEQAMVWAFFPYLLALSAAAVAMVHWRGWRWLGWGALIGASIWVPIWMIGSWNDNQASLVGLYLVLSTILFQLPALSRRNAQATPQSLPPDNSFLAALPDWIRPRQRSMVDRMAVAASPIFGGLLALLIWALGHGPVALYLLAAFAIVQLLAARRVERLVIIAWVSAGVVLLALSGWYLPTLMPAGPLFTDEGQPIVPPLDPGLPGEIVRFVWWSGGFALLFGLAGAIAMRGSARMALWASLAAWVPVALLVIAYAMLEPPTTSLVWPAVALGLAAVLVGGATVVAGHRHRPGGELALAAFAAGSVAALSLGATMLLREAWLTVALAMQVPVLAWLERRLDLRSLRAVLLLVALAVLVRLAANPAILDYQGWGWVLYGYGLPMAGFLAAAHYLRPRGDDVVVAVLEAGGLIFGVLLLSLSIRVWMADGLAEAPSSLAEVASHTAAWLGVALVLAADRRLAARPVANWGRRILLVLAGLQFVALHVVEFNPLWTYESVGDWPVINRLALAYGLPALLVLAHIRVGSPRHALARMVAWAMVALATVLELALEIRRSFQGPILSGYETGDGEWYAYSAGFLLLAVLLLVIALRQRLDWLRHAAFLLLLAVVAKVFLSDMADLEGLYRVASFIGLGLSLIGIGYLHQKLAPPTVRTAQMPQMPPQLPPAS